MRRIIAAGVILLALIMSGTSVLPSWKLEDMNRAIESTNFIVNSGCSGTLVSVPERLLITNYHCVDSLISDFETEKTDKQGFVKKVRERRYADVKLDQNGYDGYTRVRTTSYVGEIVAHDQRRDLAVVRIKGSIPHTYASPILPEGEKITRGERVYIVGNPAGNESTVVEGIISNVNRTFEFPWTERAKLPIAQFSGGIFGGNSGGALYNDKGQLIGVPAAGYSNATFIGLAIPAEVVRAFLSDNCLASVFDPKADDKACREKAAKSDKN
jgi:S1-C subfamily serine protease